MLESSQQFVQTLSTEILNPVIALMTAGALVYFIIGVITFIANADNEEDRNKGKRHITYSIIGLVVMVGVWGIIQLIANSIGVNPPDGYDQL